VANYIEVYLHFVWATWNRDPLVDDTIKPALYEAVMDACRRLECRPIAVGGMPDHIHLLVALHPTVTAANLAKAVKGASSHLVTHVIRPGVFFKWQSGYGVFSVSPNDVRRVQEYIANQERHHREGLLNHDLEQVTTTWNA
jgi:REP element-mobilizing transposase RayT